jgi:hypothetical protein
LNAHGREALRWRTGGVGSSGRHPAKDGLALATDR